MNKLFKTLPLLFAMLFVAPVWAETLDLNSASAEQLAEALDGIGEKKAAAIVQYRTDNGPFGSVDDLVDVPGIGEKTVERNRDRLMVRQVDEREAARNKQADDANAGN